MENENRNEAINDQAETSASPQNASNENGSQNEAPQQPNAQTPPQPTQPPPPTAPNPQPNNNNTNNNNRNTNANGTPPTVIHVRDRLFQALFYRLAMMYARTFSKPMRRIIEFIMLLLAITSFTLLLYLHVLFNRNPVNCLDKVQTTWPRDGILRVEILANAPEDYSLKNSYDKEYSNTVADLFSNYMNYMDENSNSNESSGEQSDTETKTENSNSKDENPNEINKNLNFDSKISSLETLIDEANTSKEYLNQTINELLFDEKGFYSSLKYKKSENKAKEPIGDAKSKETTSANGFPLLSDKRKEKSFKPALKIFKETLSEFEIFSRLRNFNLFKSYQFIEFIFVHLSSFGRALYR